MKAVRRPGDAGKPRDVMTAMRYIRKMRRQMKEVDRSVGMRISKY